MAAKWTWYNEQQYFSEPFGTYGNHWTGSYVVNPPESLQRLIFRFGWHGRYAWNTTGETSWWLAGALEVNLLLNDQVNGSRRLFHQYVGEAIAIDSQYYAAVNRSHETVATWLPVPVECDITVRRKSPESPQPPISIDWEVWFENNFPAGELLPYSPPRYGMFALDYLTSQPPPLGP